MIDTDSEHTLSASLMMNDAIEYRARLGLLIEGSTYKPILEYTPVGSSSPNIKVEGSVNVDKKPGSEYRRYTFNNVRFVVEKKGVSLLSMSHYRAYLKKFSSFISGPKI